MPSREARIGDQRQQNGASGDLTTILQNHPGDATMDDLDERYLANKDISEGDRD